MEKEDIEALSGMYEDYLDDVENHIWTDKAGNRHKIEEMKTQHLINCLNKINREEDFRQEFKKLIADELKDRGIEK